MRIGILGFDIDEGSGQSRFAVNLSTGLHKLGIDVLLFAYSCDEKAKSALLDLGIVVHNFKYKMNFIDKYRVMSDSTKVFSEMMALIKGAGICDYYIVLNDALIGISEFKTEGKWVYISNGDLLFMYLNERFLKENSPFSYITSKRFVKQSNKHQRAVMKYDSLLSNSGFTMEIMSFFLNSLFTNYVYPPVDTKRFKPINDRSVDPYALVLLRSNAEPASRYIEKLSKSIPIKIVGNATIEGSKTLGRISDDELVKVYSNATVTISASLQEFFGYSIAESLSCGTPVISLAHGGANELVENGINGWLVGSQMELNSKTQEIFQNGYEDGIRRNARKSSDKFSVESSSARVLSLLKEIE